MIQLCDVREQYRQLKEEIDAAMQAVAEAGVYILGPNVKALEQEIAAYCGCTYGIGVNSGTDALHLALRALQIGPGDEVITTPFTFVATTEAIGWVGATPVFVDIDPATFNIDVTKIEAAITPRTKAILPVHLYGQPCEMAEIMTLARKYGVRVVEDCAQALGARYQESSVGAIGDIGCLSFFPSKNLGAFGDGGMVVTQDAALAEQVDILRRHGGKVKYHHTELGVNSRLDELQAAILRVKLRHLTRWVDARRQCAYTYNAAFTALPGIQTPRECCNGEYRSPTMQTAFPPEQRLAAYHQYTVLVEHRNAVQSQLKELGIQTMIYYPVALHQQEVHAALGKAAGSFPQAEWVADHCLSIPIYPEMREEQQAIVIQGMMNVLANAQPLAA